MSALEGFRFDHKGWACAWKAFHFVLGCRGSSCRCTLPHVLHPAVDWDYVGNVLIVLLQLHEVGNVQEGIALQADVNKSRLHSGEDASYASLIDRSCEGVFIFALEVNFREQIVLD